MKAKHLLLLVIIAAFSSCSSSFRTGQTPDDVYYSPAPPPPAEYVRMDNEQDRDSYAYNNSSNSEDYAIRRGISNPRYRSNISLDLGYGYNPYDFYGSSFYSPYSSFNNGYSSFYNPYSSYYSPYGHSGVSFYPYNNNYYGYSPFNNYYYPPVYVSGSTSRYTGPRTVNLGAYNNGSRNTLSGANRAYNLPAGQSRGNVAPVRTFTAPPPPANRTSGVGNFIRRVFTPSENNTRSSDNNRSYRSDNNSYNNNNNSSNNNSSPARTIQPSSSGSSSSSSSSSSGSSAPVRTFRK